MKKISLITVVLILAMSIQADPVSQAEAGQIARNFYSIYSGMSFKDCVVEDVIVYEYRGINTFYCYYFATGGFVMVAADDASLPILGYSLKGFHQRFFDHPALKEWLDGYSREIHHIIFSGLENGQTLNEWEAISKGELPSPSRDVEPLLTTEWWQGCYYNELCPADLGATQYCGHTVTGCIATAMGQIMKYHSYPHQGVGIHSYTHPIYGTQAVDFGNSSYNWDDMPATLNNHNINVATILYHAGVSVDMNYGYIIGSSSVCDRVPKALVDYFNYHPGIELHYQSDYVNMEDWKSLLRSNLDQQLPVYYSGWYHAFICDGYRLTEDRFHFNWGWGGNYDGWFLMGLLNPAGQNYNFRNLAIVNIIPYNEELITRVIQPVDKTLYEAGSSIQIEAETIIGFADQMMITIDGNPKYISTTNTISYIWSTTEDDIGVHKVRAWSFAGNDTTYHEVIVNVAKWKTQASGFQSPKQMINHMSVVDSNIVWAVARDGFDEILGWDIPIQEFTRTVNGGEEWTAGTIADCEGLGTAMIHGISDKQAYIAMYRLFGNKPQGIYVTEDGGETWSRQSTATFAHPNSWANCVHFFNENEGWCMGDPTVESFEMYTTTDGGINWEPLPSGNSPPALNNEYGMTGGYSSVNNTIWFGTTKGRIFRSTDKGYHWTAYNVPVMEEEWIIPVFRDENHGLLHNFFLLENIYEVYIQGDSPGKICETFDGGITWHLIDRDGPMFCSDLAFIPGTENTWMSTGGRERLDKGISISQDGGHTWQIQEGTEGIKFRNMQWFNEFHGYIGGYNVNESEGGVFKCTGGLLYTNVNYPAPKALAIKVYPNPFSTATNIEVNLEKASNIAVSIYNHLGQQIDVLYFGNGFVGPNTFKWTVSAIPSGLYFIKVQSDRKSSILKIIKTN